MFTTHWVRPTYHFRAPRGKDILIDVTTSVSPGLSANQVFVREVIPFFKSYNVRTILDVGAGSLRHTLPLLDAGFEVCIVEFPDGFKREVCKKRLAQAQTYPNFCELVWPRDFKRESRRFDAALLIYVLQTMPIPRERTRLLKYVFSKLNRPSFLFYCSRFNQLPPSAHKYRVSDGYYMYPTRNSHSFYREFRTDETHEMMSEHGFLRIRSLSKRGTDQMFIYFKGDRWPL